MELKSVFSNSISSSFAVSLHIKPPALTSNVRDLTRLKREARALGLAVRGAGGNHSDTAEGGLADISPSARHGVTEWEIMGRLYNGAAALWAMETA